ncbi:MAG: MBL fold metallo-hydrolase [Lachnospiraceae bacterium]|nr:MBL fold metallo-hydrolase [Lachnospiraceae bacterium]
MKVISLVENTTKLDCPVEHGLSLYIETEKHTILFDTGQGTLFRENAERFNVDLSKVDICVLSHGHYDHGGGLKEFTRVNDTAKIYMNKNAFGFHYNAMDKYIGLEREWLSDEEFQARVVYVDGQMKLDDELTIYGPGNKKVIDMGSAGLTMKEDGKLVPEDFRHEHYLEIFENGKRILISGCSHQGIINIMSWFSPDVLIGGFHFMKQELGETLAGYGKQLNEFDADYYTCHCTGVEQFEFLRPYIKRMNYLSEGAVLEV